MPSNFQRKWRGFDEIKHWKATEYRSFLLYTGPFVLKKILKEDKLQHFLLLHTAIYILVSEGSSLEWVKVAFDLITRFVSEIPKLYYKEMLIYNIHSLLHLCGDAKLHGALDNFSAFDFESFMQKIKRMLRTNSSHLAQVVKRSSEANNVQFSNTYKPAALRGHKISCKTRDNCYLTKNRKYCIIVETEPNFIVSFLDIEENIDWYPISSSKFGIHLVKNINPPQQFSSNHIVKKCIFLRDVYDDKSFVIPFCNSTIS